MFDLNLNSPLSFLFSSVIRFVPFLALLLILNLSSISKHKLTCLALIQNFAGKFCFTYAFLVGSKLFFNCFLLASFYSVFIILHFLLLSPFWQIVSEVDKRAFNSYYYKYCKHLLNLPPWAKNSRKNSKYGATSPLLQI